MANRIALLGCVAALALVGGCSGGPKTDAQGFVIDPDFEKNLQQKLLDEKSGDYRLAKYSNIKMNEKIPDSTFRLKTTSKTRVVSPQG